MPIRNPTFDRFAKPLALVFALAWAMDLWLKFRIGQPLAGLWLCSVYLAILALGFFLKSRLLLWGSACTLAVLQLPYTLDYLGMAFAGKSLFHTMDYAFHPDCRFGEFLSASRHLFMLPLAVLGIFAFGPPDRSRSQSAVALAIAFNTGVYAFSRLLSTEWENLNCSFTACGNLNGGLSGWTYFIAFPLAVNTLTWGVHLGLLAILRRRARIPNAFLARVFAASLAFLTLTFVLGILRYDRIVGIPWQHPARWF
ncbi:MAG: hypothetical protein NDJ89_18735 [Oligoflexia bacterium]|nr:hypothetical protein [Oligoflexia bacterium]